MDVARTVFRHGAEEVFIIYNKSEQTSTARAHKGEYAKIDGAKFEYYKTAVEFDNEGVMLVDSNVFVD